MLGLVNLLELLVVGYSPGLLAMAESVRTRTRFEGVGVDGDATDERGEVTHLGTDARFGSWLIAPTRRTRHGQRPPAGVEIVSSASATIATS